MLEQGLQWSVTTSAAPEAMPPCHQRADDVHCQADMIGSEMQAVWSNRVSPRALSGRQQQQNSSSARQVLHTDAGKRPQLLHASQPCQTCCCQVMQQQPVIDSWPQASQCCQAGIQSSDTSVSGTAANALPLLLLGEGLPGGAGINWEAVLRQKEAMS